MQKPCKILLVEDHALTRKGLKYGINKTDKFQVVGEALDGLEAVELCSQLAPDIVIMDIGLPVKDGIKATKEIKEMSPQSKVIILTTYADKDKVFSAFEAGANAYCMKDVKMPILLQIIETVLEGGIWLDSQIAGYIMALLPQISPGKVSPPESSTSMIGQNEVYDLTLREKEILTLISEGMTNKDIAQKLSLSIYTVKNHVSSVIGKLAVDDRTQAAIVAIKKGLL